MNSTSLTERYQAIHRTGHDCRITCARNILEFHGQKISYPTVQGLSSDLFFTYRKGYDGLDRLLFPSAEFCDMFMPISGQRIESLQNLAYTFNATLLINERQHTEEALEAIRPYLDAGLPVMVAVSREVLRKHLNLRHELFPGIHFGSHWIIATAINDARRTVTIFETDIARGFEIPFETFALARSFGEDDDTCFLKSRNRWAVFVPPATPPPPKHMAHIALAKVAYNMQGAQESSGLPALRALKQELPHWCENEAVSAKVIKGTVFMLRFGSDKLAGGSLGRKYFGMFLKHAFRHDPRPRLDVAATHYGAATDLWRSLMETLEGLMKSGDPKMTFNQPRIKDLLDRIVDHEEAGLSNITECFA